MLPPGLAVSETVPVLQIGPLFVGPAVGVAFTVAVVVYVFVHPRPEPLVTVTE